MPSSHSDFEFTGSMQPVFTIGECTFADAGNLEHCAKYLNQTLVTFGFPASLHLFAADPVSIAGACNCIYSLLQQRQRDIEFRESANDQRQRLQSCPNTLQSLRSQARRLQLEAEREGIHPAAAAAEVV